jgi:hypothetical protein
MDKANYSIKMDLTIKDSLNRGCDMAMVLIHMLMVILTRGIGLRI